MNCENCKCWYRGIPIAWYVTAPLEIRQKITCNDYGFCTVLDDVTFVNTGCKANATDKQKDEAEPLC